MDTRKKGKLIGAIGALVIHTLLLLGLVWITFVLPEPEEESGVPILVGDFEHALGGEKLDHFTEVDILQEELEAQAEIIEPEVLDLELITQDVEESVQIEEVKEKPKEKTAEELKQEKELREKILLEQQRKEAEEAKRQEKERLEKERKKKEEAARKRVSGAFGKGAQMTGKELGTEKVKDGVSNVPSTAVSSAKESGYGTYDLHGRSIGKGGLPRPVYTVSVEGTVSINIRVNPAGKVIATSINLSGTDVSDPTLRKAAEDAAKQARFNEIEGKHNQDGTITYKFKLK